MVEASEVHLLTEGKPTRRSIRKGKGGAHFLRKEAGKLKKTQKTIHREEGSQGRAAWYK